MNTDECWQLVFVNLLKYRTLVYRLFPNINWSKYTDILEPQFCHIACFLTIPWSISVDTLTIRIMLYKQTERIPHLLQYLWCHFLRCCSHIYSTNLQIKIYFYINFPFFSLFSLLHLYICAFSIFTYKELNCFFLLHFYEMEIINQTLYNLYVCIFYFWFHKW